MALQLQNLEDKKRRLNNCNTGVFTDAQNSFTNFLRALKVNEFRHIQDLELAFEHPVTVISGTNKVGKTSLLLLIACSFENFRKVDSTSPAGQLKDHNWSDVLTFTSHENVTNDYSYELKWRVGASDREGEGKRLASSQAWSGLGRKNSDTNPLHTRLLTR